MKRFERDCWDRFWAAAEEQERRELGANAPSAPIAGSERAVFIETIASCRPFCSVLEVGCGYGQNAHILSELFPGIRYVGIDSDRQRVEEGQKLFTPSQRQRLRIVVGDARDLSAFGKDSADLILSSAFLLYVAPDELTPMLDDFCRIARCGIVLLEQHDASLSEDLLVEEAGRPAYWIRNYSTALINGCGNAAVSEISVAHSRWTLERWSTLARIFLIRVERG